LKGFDVVMARLVYGACGIKKPGECIHMSIVMEPGRYVKCSSFFLIEN